jgi:hypothetical protein
VSMSQTRARQRGSERGSPGRPYRIVLSCSCESSVCLASHPSMQLPFSGFEVGANLTLEVRLSVARFFALKAFS